MGVPIIAEFNLQERKQWNVAHAYTQAICSSAVLRREIW